MKAIIGLGNPEPKYSLTRHNVGKDVANLLAKDWNLAWKNASKLGVLLSEGMVDQQKFLLVKPAAFMNTIGSSIKRVVDYYGITLSDLMIIYDELDLVVGEYKLKFAKSSKIHNGILSVEEHLKTKNFWHLRIGVRDKNIDQSVQKTGRDPSRYVLTKFAPRDQEKISGLYRNTLFGELSEWLSKK